MTASPMTAVAPRRRAPQPFTVDHFRAWAAELELDNGQPWIVEPFFLDCVEDYFAGTPENWWVVPEGNSKTTSTAGLAVYLLEFRKRAEIPWGAASRDQAEIGYRQAEGFAKAPRLGKLLRCYPGYRRIINPSTGGRLQIFAADDGTGDGIIPSDAFLDELHRHKNLRLYRTWSGKLVKRGGQLATISTAGEPGSEFEQTRERIRQETPVVESRPGYIHCRSRRIALHEYAVPEDGDVEDMAIVKLANPFSGITEETLADKFASPTITMVHWRRMVCNLPTRAENAAVQEVEWHAAAVDDPIPEGVHIWCGMDIAWKWDTTSIAPLWMRDPEYRLLGPARILVPPRDGTQMDEDVVRRALTEIHGRNPIDHLVVDPTDARELVRWASEELGVAVIERPPTVLTRIEDFARFMEALRNGWLKHSGDRGLTQHVLNAQVHILPKGDPVFERPSQTRQGGNQELRVIDALSAASMVHAIASAQPEAEAVPMASWG
jgi:phage terminase large subunit-like protein